VIAANILSYGGSILSVSGVVVKGDLEALAKISYQPTASATGGNIGAVRARDLRSKLIHADFYLTSLTTSGAGFGGTNIEAQGGGTLKADGSLAARAPITVALGGVFSGQIHFIYSNRIPDSLAVTYSAAFRKLLTFSDVNNPTPTTWQADNAPAGAADIVTLKDAIFQEMNRTMQTPSGKFLLNGQPDQNWYVGN
jgi:hypothetical protein